MGGLPYGQIMLPWEGRGFSQELAGRHVSGGHCGCTSQDIRPVFDNGVFSDLAAYQTLQLFWGRFGIEDIKTLGWQIIDFMSKELIALKPLLKAGATAPS